MEYLGYFFVVLFVVSLAHALFIVWRNQSTHDFRMKVLNRVSECAMGDILSGDENRAKVWRERYYDFESVSYNKVLYSFKPFRASAYWDDLSFLNGEDVTL